MNKRRFLQNAYVVIGALFGTKEFTLINFLFILAIIFLMAWLPDAVADFLHLSPLDKILICGVVLLCIWFVVRKAAKRASMSLGVDVQKASSLKGLVLLLSKRNKDEPYGLPLEQITSNWKMPLLAILAHKDSLQRVVVIGSSESILQKNEFIEFVGHYIPNLSEKITFLEEDGKDFMDAQKVFDLIQKAFSLLEDEKISSKNIAIDVTGGSKIVSIAGAIFALPNDKKIQYVSGNGSVKFYDLCYKEELAY
jgi:hypothetical protein